MLRFHMKRFIPALSAVVLAMTLASCGGGAGDPRQVITSDLKVAASSSTTGALAGKAFGFTGGVTGLGTAGTDTTVTFTSGTSFGISAGGSTASGTTSYGSCIFTVQTTTFTSGPLSVVGVFIVINPCDILLDTGGQTASNSPTPTPAVLILGALTSNPVSVDVVIQNGVLFVGGTSFGTVTVVQATGATGGSGGL